jgi:hypothetical protein
MFDCSAVIAFSVSRNFEFKRILFSEFFLLRLLEDPMSREDLYIFSSISSSYSPLLQLIG